MSNGPKKGNGQIGNLPPPSSRGAGSTLPRS